MNDQLCEQRAACWIAYMGRGAFEAAWTVTEAAALAICRGGRAYAVVTRERAPTPCVSGSTFPYDYDVLTRCRAALGG